VITKESISQPSFIKKFKHAVINGNKEKEKMLMNSVIVIYGTKLAHLIAYLHKLWASKPESRIILFSKYTALLKDVQNVLEKSGIGCTTVKGTVYQRNKAIDTFKGKLSTECKVILLSLKNAASGTNLIEGSHVILLDPMSGSKRNADAIESQAIGRAYRQGQDKQVTVVRLIVRNTIEHELYLASNLTADNPQTKIAPALAKVEEDTYLMVMFGKKTPGNRMVSIQTQKIPIEVHPKKELDENKLDRFRHAKLLKTTLSSSESSDEDEWVNINIPIFHKAKNLNTFSNIPPIGVLGRVPTIDIESDDD